uniref:CN hydrolase domain-containing protein n=1 Tax=Macrostomum lignano TaxID=282301 RepID=A0A1I8J6I1_9PLAT
MFLVKRCRLKSFHSEDLQTHAMTLLARVPFTTTGRSWRKSPEHTRVTPPNGLSCFRTSRRHLSTDSRSFRLVMEISSQTISRTLRNTSACLDCAPTAQTSLLDRSSRTGILNLDLSAWQQSRCDSRRRNCQGEFTAAAHKGQQNLQQEGLASASGRVQEVQTARAGHKIRSHRLSRFPDLGLFNRVELHRSDLRRHGGRRQAVLGQAVTAHGGQHALQLAQRQVGDFLSAQISVVKPQVLAQILGEWLPQIRMTASRCLRALGIRDWTASARQRRQWSSRCSRPRAVQAALALGHSTPSTVCSASKLTLLAFEFAVSEVHLPAARNSRRFSKQRHSSVVQLTADDVAGIPAWHQPRLGTQRGQVQHRVVAPDVSQQLWHSPGGQLHLAASTAEIACLHAEQLGTAMVACPVHWPAVMGWSFWPRHRLRPDNKNGMCNEAICNQLWHEFCNTARQVLPQGGCVSFQRGSTQLITHSIKKAIAITNNGDYLQLLKGSTATNPIGFQSGSPLCLSLSLSALSVPLPLFFQSGSPLCLSLSISALSIPLPLFFQSGSSLCLSLSMSALSIPLPLFFQSGIPLCLSLSMSALSIPLPLFFQSGIPLCLGFCLSPSLGIAALL